MISPSPMTKPNTNALDLPWNDGLILQAKYCIIIEICHAQKCKRINTIRQKNKAPRRRPPTERESNLLGIRYVKDPEFLTSRPCRRLKLLASLLRNISWEKIIMHLLGYQVNRISTVPLVDPAAGFRGGGYLARGPNLGYPKTENSTDLAHYFLGWAQIHFRKNKDFF